MSKLKKKNTPKNEEENEKVVKEEAISENEPIINNEPIYDSVDAKEDSENKGGEKVKKSKPKKNNKIVKENGKNSKLIKVGALLLVGLLVGVGIHFFNNSGNIGIMLKNIKDTEQYVNVGDLDKIKVEKMQEPKLTNEQLTNAINVQLEKIPETKEIKEGEIDDTARVRCDITSKFKGSDKVNKDKDLHIVLRSNGYFYDLEQRISDMKIGETKTFKIKIPDSVEETKFVKKEDAGKTMISTVKVKSAFVLKKAELTDEYVKTNYKDKNLKNVEDFKKYIQKKELARIKNMNESIAYENVWNSVIENSTQIKLPKEEVNNEKEILTKIYKDASKKANMTLEEYVLNSLGIGLDEFKQQVNSFAENKVFEKLVLQDIVKKERIKVSEKDYDNYIRRYLAAGEGEYTGSTNFAEVKKMYEDSFGGDNIKFFTTKYVVTKHLYDKLVK